ncbi:MAG: hypothetical protein JWN77_1370, partial [Frankiales bacterium]|nr:hypothetical protein [Frankiales bacterium]
MRLLVLSNGPVPYGPRVVVEGGGLRCWGLARGLQAHGHEVTVGVDAAFGDLELVAEGLRVTSFRRDEALIRLMEHMDAVIVSYCMGGTTEYVVSHLPDGVLLVGDAYVPIHVEVSARDATDVELEQREFMADLPRWNSALQRCDLLLVASEEQRLYYTGLLAALGRVTPMSYRDTRMLLTPFGVHGDEVPPAERDRSDGSLRALWFGGVYPWFDASALIGSVRLATARGVPVTLTMAGAKNPFVRHGHFVEHADAAIELAEASGDVQLLPWLPYAERGRAYETSDVIVSLNTIGPENAFSWRTRVVDYIWSGLPLLTNGGDPLAERLIAAGAAMRLSAATPEAVADALETLHREPERLVRMRQVMAAQRRTLDWQRCVEPLALALAAGILPLEPVEMPAAGAFGAAPGAAVAPTTVTQARVAAARTYALRARRHARAYGVARTAVMAARVLSSKVPKPTPAAAAPHMWIISHQLDTSGAPKVALDVAADARRALGRGRVTVLCFPPVAASRQAEARRAEVPVKVLQRGMPLPLLRPHDTVVLNSLAIPKDVINDVLWRLEHGRLAGVQWFVHEDQPQRWWDPGLVPRVAALVEAGLLRLLVPSQQMQARHAKHLWLDRGVDLVPLRIEVPDRLRGARGPEAFDRLVFHLTGAAHDGRKGHTAALAAFQELVLTTDMGDRSRWRDFELQMIGLGEDFASGELRHLGPAVLGDRFRTFDAEPHDEALRLMSKANVVLCCAVYEAFGLYISESMAMGHVVLRNSAAGMEEQLEDGRNGLWIVDQDQATFVAALRRVLDRDQTSNDELSRW